MKHKQPSQIIYSTKEVSENLQLLRKLKNDSSPIKPIQTQSNVENNQSYCSLYKTNQQKTTNENQDAITNSKKEIERLLLENKDIKEKYASTQLKIEGLERDYYPFSCVSDSESDYQVLFSFKFINLNYLFVKRTDQSFNLSYYWIKQDDIKKQQIDYNEIGLPGIYFDAFDNFIDYRQLKDELNTLKGKLFEKERLISKLEQLSSSFSTQHQTRNSNLLICNQTLTLSLMKEANEKIPTHSSPKMELGNGTKVDMLVQSWKEYEEEKPNSKTLCDKTEFNEDINAEQAPVELQKSTSERFITRSAFYDKMTQVILTYKAKLIDKEREVMEDYSSLIEDKDRQIQSYKRDNDQSIIENQNMKKLLIDLKALLKMKEEELAKVSQYESQIAALKLSISSLQQANYFSIHALNQKESQLNLKENKINSMKIQLKEKDNQIADYCKIIKKLGTTIELSERIELKEQSYPEDGIDDIDS